MSTGDVPLGVLSRRIAVFRAAQLWAREQGQHEMAAVFGGRVDVLVERRAEVAGRLAVAMSRATRLRPGASWMTFGPQEPS